MMLPKIRMLLRLLMILSALLFVLAVTSAATYADTHPNDNMTLSSPGCLRCHSATVDRPPYDAGHVQTGDISPAPDVGTFAAVTGHPARPGTSAPSIMRKAQWYPDARLSGPFTGNPGGMRPSMTAQRVCWDLRLGKTPT